MTKGARTMGRKPQRRTGCLHFHSLRNLFRHHRQLPKPQPRPQFIPDPQTSEPLNIDAKRLLRLQSLNPDLAARFHQLLLHDPQAALRLLALFDVYTTSPDTPQDEDVAHDFHTPSMVSPRKHMYSVEGQQPVIIPPDTMSSFRTPQKRFIDDVLLAAKPHTPSGTIPPQNSPHSHTPAGSEHPISLEAVPLHLVVNNTQTTRRNFESPTCPNTTPVSSPLGSQGPASPRRGVWPKHVSPKHVSSPHVSLSHMSTPLMSPAHTSPSPAQVSPTHVSPFSQSMSNLLSPLLHPLGLLRHTSNDSSPATPTSADVPRLTHPETAYRRHTPHTPNTLTEYPKLRRTPHNTHMCPHHSEKNTACIRPRKLKDVKKSKTLPPPLSSEQIGRTDLPRPDDDVTSVPSIASPATSELPVIVTPPMGSLSVPEMCEPVPHRKCVEETSLRRHRTVGLLQPTECSVHNSSARWEDAVDGDGHTKAEYRDALPSHSILNPTSFYFKYKTTN
eukprot:Blabericola_migrator_1__13043@NODE_878_length_6197_cov_81_643556_g621_i0_p2_GENE_NODE_878_length_6197_cov_81_643556_g621_i0NODE_878_length_6197_cov_81_643556_g621_i0_p2_ORF_typecomplete_len501_score89_51_NODE_878_length_6197_cov_81_643556_g621_i03031805